MIKWVVAVSISDVNDDAIILMIFDRYGKNIDSDSRGKLWIILVIQSWIFKHFLNIIIADINFLLCANYIYFMPLMARSAVLWATTFHH